jgi:hypothetical protein
MASHIGCKFLPKSRPANINGHRVFFARKVGDDYILGDIAETNQKLSLETE